jgi:hypothetical protein
MSSHKIKLYFINAAIVLIGLVGIFVLAIASEALKAIPLVSNVCLILGFVVCCGYCYIELRDLEVIFEINAPDDNNELMEALSDAINSVVENTQPPNNNDNDLPY